LAPMSAPLEGLLTVRPRGSNAIHVPWLITVRPRHDELLSSIQLSNREFAPSDTAPAVLSFQAGRISAGGPPQPGPLPVPPPRPAPPRKRRPQARPAGPAARPPARALRLRTDRPRRERRHARAGQVPGRADRVPDGAGRADGGDRAVHDSVNGAHRLILAAGR